VGTWKEVFAPKKPTNYTPVPSQTRTDEEVTKMMAEKPVKGGLNVERILSEKRAREGGSRSRSLSPAGSV
jgi:hypothetical protein